MEQKFQKDVLTEWVLAGVYADKPTTGASTVKRDELKRLLKDCDDGKIDIILVKSISRFARNTVDTLEMVRHLKEIGVITDGSVRIWKKRRSLDQKYSFLRERHVRVFIVRTRIQGTPGQVSSLRCLYARNALCLGRTAA